MAENEEGQERTEEATPKRREDARKKGNVPRSRELNTMILLVGLSISLMIMGQFMYNQLQKIMKSNFILTREQLSLTSKMQDALFDAGLDMLVCVAPILLISIVLALIGPILLGGFIFNAESFLPQLERLNPLSGITKVFSVKGLIEMLKAFLKFLIIALIAIGLLYRNLPDILILSDGDITQRLSESIAIIERVFFYLCLSMALIAGFDAPLQIWQYTKQLKMTRQEIRDEFKESEGKPEVKSRIRRLQQEIATRRMMQEVPKADVVITNPEHYAVALRYDAQKMAVPIVIAKGANELAMRIRVLATKHNVTLLSAPPLARSLFFNTKLNREIPEGLYVAVAQILAYVYQLRQLDSKEIPPKPPKDLPIPEELRRDE